ncbi:MAG TPA: hydroxymethylbilane synthase [Pyrinomonadaceae bacterium]|nr:hydroxymethylbilane synthase [Pyrinomonadaceae bacterium]
MSRRLVIGSRGSKLAMWQAEQARARLLALYPEVDVQIEIIKTTGDVKTDPLSVIGGKGVFTKELEDALLDRRIDLAVHSLKDLPTVLPDGLTISAICQRDDPRDALVVRDDLKARGGSILNLPEKAVVGTSSQRRVAQLKALRGDVVIRDVRGNVDTRLRKLDEGQYDALILASAGLRRLELESRIDAAISTAEMVPAVGQGAIAIETRADDEFAIETTGSLDHEETRLCCLAERAFLRSLGGGCQFPIAGHAIIDEEQLRLDGLVATPDGAKILRDQLSGSQANPDEIGSSLAALLIERGAHSLLNPR